jgi:hypothetical protein
VNHLVIFARIKGASHKTGQRKQQKGNNYRSQPSSILLLPVNISAQWSAPAFNQGLQYRNRIENRCSPVLTETVKTRKQSVFGTQFEFQILKKKNQKPSNFFDLPVGFFWFIDRFLTGFYLKFNFWMKNNKLVDFFHLSLDFSGFYFFKIFQSFFLILNENNSFSVKQQNPCDFRRYFIPVV